MPAPTQLSALQLAILRVLWARGECPVADVREALAATRPLALTTVSTVLSRLEKQGLVAHRREGRQYVWRAIVAEADAEREMVGELTERLFDGDVPRLVAQLLDARDVEAGDLERIRALLERKESELRAKRSEDEA